MDVNINRSLLPEEKTELLSSHLATISSHIQQYTTILLPAIFTYRNEDGPFTKTNSVVGSVTFSNLETEEAKNDNMIHQKGSQEEFVKNQTTGMCHQSINQSISYHQSI
ncbi:hypothetical protein WUBG_01443 [Wuchereria bancrofti]|uniref:Uncharacterized protein n=1 Tax=Wuchereria bancrofti TaxID=6293 RepID=J9EZH9_WUCBA|nr:hypothetical protein WUBG_01443 [Wuchereria bancrofti]